MIRNGTRADIDAWMEAVQRVRQGFPGLETQEALHAHRQSVLSCMEQGTALCDEREGRIAGLLLYTREPAEIAFLAVDPEYRRMGIASALLHAALDALRRAEAVSVTTWREDAQEGRAARALYRQFGFIPEGLTEAFGWPCEMLVRRAGREGEEQA